MNFLMQQINRGSIFCCIIFTVRSIISSETIRRPQWVLFKALLGNCTILEQNLNYSLSSIFAFLLELFFVWKNTEFWEIYFLTKFVPKSMKMDLYTSPTPFWNEISISNLLILSNFCCFGLHCHSFGKHLCRSVWIRLY